VTAVSTLIKWDVACRIVDVLVSKYSHILSPATVMELRSSVNNMDTKTFIKKLHECIETLVNSGVEDREIERLMGNLFDDRYLIFSGA